MRVGFALFLMERRKDQGAAVRPLLFGLCRYSPRSPPTPARNGEHLPFMIRTKGDS